MNFLPFKRNRISNNVIFMCWTDETPMSEARKQCFDQFKSICGCNVVLITPENLNRYILKDHPLHEGYQYLSALHKSDYLRIYLMHFYGGGYSDVKRTAGDWNSAFQDLLNHPTKIINGYHEHDEGAIAYLPHKPFWKVLLGNGAFIARKNTELTQALYNALLELMDSKIEELRKFPAKVFNDTKDRGSGTGYPLCHAEVMGNNFHRGSLPFIDKFLYTVPFPLCYAYK